MKKVFNIKISSKIFLITLAIIVVLSGIGVFAVYNYVASDIKYTKKDGTEISVSTALDDLYSKQNTNEFEGKEYITTGLTCVSGNVEIVSGGYYTDTNTGVTYLNITLKTLKNVPGSDSMGFLTGLPAANDFYVIADTTNKYAVRLGMWSTDGRMVYFDRAGTGIPANTTLTYQFKY